MTHPPINPTTEPPGVLTEVATYIVTACPATPYNMGSYDIRVELCHGFDGDTWAVRWHGRCLSTTGEWSMEPIPSFRTRAWIRRYRFPDDVSAIVAARDAAPNISVNGVTAKDAALAARTRP